MISFRSVLRLKKANISKLKKTDRVMGKFQKILIVFFIIVFPAFSFAAEDNTVDFEWLDDDKEIYVLQNRKYRKVNRFNLSLLGTINLSESFVDTIGGGIKAAYFFGENWGIELALGMGSQSENNSFKGVREQSALAFYRAIKSYTAASFVWSPFYGKFNTFNYIYYLDWFLSVGLANISTEHNGRTFTLTGTQIGDGEQILETDSSAGLTWSTGLYWYLSKMLSVRFEFTGFHFQAERYTSGAVGVDPETNDIWFHNYNMSVGLNFMF